MKDDNTEKLLARGFKWFLGAWVASATLGIAFTAFVCWCIYKLVTYFTGG